MNPGMYTVRQSSEYVLGLSEREREGDASGTRLSPRPPCCCVKLVTTATFTSCYMCNDAVVQE